VGSAFAFLKESAFGSPPGDNSPYIGVAFFDVEYEKKFSMIQSQIPA
jgi:hypothetical protein